MRTATRGLARTALGAVALTLVTAAGGCGSGGPGAYLLDLLESGERPAAANLMPRLSH